jgi:hypothetical protein
MKNAKITVIATKPNGTVLLFRAASDRDAIGYATECLSRGWVVDIDNG